MNWILPPPELSISGRLVFFLQRGCTADEAADVCGVRREEARRILARPLVQRALKAAMKAKEPPE